MKWYQVDSDTPNDPKVKAIIRKGLADGGPTAAAAMVGHLFLLWCYVSNHGEAQPGMGVKADGDPLPLGEMADECLVESEAHLRTLLDFLALKDLIDQGLWLRQGIVFLKGMAKRADTYAKRKGRVSSNSVRTLHPETPLQDSTIQDITKEKDQNHVSLPAADLLTVAGGEDQVDGLVRIWNQERTPGPKVAHLNPVRRLAYGKAIKAAPDLADWRLVIGWLNRQPWCNAQGTGGHATWQATLDWLAKPGKLAEKLDLAKAERVTVRADDIVGRDPAKGRTGARRGQFAEALKGGGGDDESIH